MPDAPEPSAALTQPPPAPPPAPGEGEASALAPPSGRRPFRELRRELSEQDFNSPGVAKLLLDELDQSIAECGDLRGYLQKYYEAEKARAVLEERLSGKEQLDAERLRGRVSGDIVFGSGGGGQCRSWFRAEHAVEPPVAIFDIGFGAYRGVRARKGFEAMKLQVVGIADRGVPGKERVNLKVSSDTDLIYYVVFQTSYGTPPTNVYNKSNNSYWLPAKVVKAGDWVVLMTGSGTNTETKASGGVTNHYLYWGSTGPLFAAPSSCVVIFEVGSWVATRPSA